MRLLLVALLLTRSLSDFTALSSRARQGQPLSVMLSRVPGPDRDRLNALYKSDPDAFLFLVGVTSIDAAEAQALAGSKARILVLNDLSSLDEAAAKQLAKFKGEQLYLDNVQLTQAAAKQLVTFGGKLISLGDGRHVELEAMPELKHFKGAIALSLGGGSSPAPEPIDAANPASGRRTEDEVDRLRTIVQAIHAGDVAGVKQYLKQGGVVDWGESGHTLLMEAAYHKQLAVVKVLLGAGANPGLKSPEEDTALKFAVQVPFFSDKPGDPAVIQSLCEALVAKGARVDDGVIDKALEQAEKDLGANAALKAGWKKTLVFLGAKSGRDLAASAKARGLTAVAAALK